VDLLLLKTFLKVAAVGNITKAATVLFVTQSAVSRRIKQLEDTVGKPLLQRNGSSLTPTEAGLLLIEKGRKMLDLEQEFFSGLANDTPQKQKIAFCSTPSLGIDRLPKVLTTFITDHAQTVDLNCVFAMPEEALAGIETGRFDLALIEHCDEIDLKGRLFQPLPDDEVVFISAPSLGIEADCTSVERMFRERLYLKTENGCARRFIEKNLRRIGRSCKEFASVVYFDDFTFILNEVRAGNGITFVSKALCREELASGRLRCHHVDGFLHHRPRTLVLGQSELTAQQQNLLDYLYREFGIIRPQETLSQAS
jgi:DNA-binding transcriptional LysR family regulator